MIEKDFQTVKSVNVEPTKTDQHEAIKKILVKWYRERALSALATRMKKYSKYFDNQPIGIGIGIGIRNDKFRWESCTKD